MAALSFDIPSSDPALLAKAVSVAEDFASRQVQPGVAGVVFLGAVARGYFDPYADIDVGIFTNPGAAVPPPASYSHEQGFEIHAFMSDLAQEAAQPWDMAKRWAFSTHRLFYDPDGLLVSLFQQKIPLQPEERCWLMIEGMTQSEWCISTLPRLWAARGDLAGAQYQFNEGINFFLNAMFGLNDRLVPDFKWRYYCAARLPVLPPGFRSGMEDLLRVSAFDQVDIDRRFQAFMGLWQAVLPLVEAEVCLPFNEFAQLV